MTITNEDNMELMARYEDSCFNWAVCDPPYGIKESSKNHNSRNTPVKQKNGNNLQCKYKNYEQSNWDESPPSDEFFVEVKRVSINQIIFGANYFSQVMTICKTPRKMQYEPFLKNNPKGFIIWDKVNGDNDFNDCEIIYTSLDFDSYILYYMWSGMMQGLVPSRVKAIASRQIGNKKRNENRIHETQKPVKLYIYLLKEFADIKDKILDTHRGSGSIDIAIDFMNEYHKMKLDLTSCEIDKEKFDAANERSRNHQKQLPIKY